MWVNIYLKFSIFHLEFLKFVADASHDRLSSDEMQNIRNLTQKQLNSKICFVGVIGAGLRFIKI